MNNNNSEYAKLYMVVSHVLELKKLISPEEMSLEEAKDILLTKIKHYNTEDRNIALSILENRFVADKSVTEMIDANLKFIRD